MHQMAGEDVAALGIGRKLNFINRQKRNVDAAGHGFHGADIIARRGGQDFFLARYERNLARANLPRHLVIHLARQQPQRQAYHAALVTEHALDGQVRLTGVRWPEHCGDAAAAIVTFWGVRITHWIKGTPSKLFSRDDQTTRAAGGGWFGEFAKTGNTLTNLIIDLSLSNPQSNGNGP
jgi:hypothetical protein